jgi:hypothetical protein
MKQPAKNRRTDWFIGALVLATGLAFGKIATSHTNDAGNQYVPQTTIERPYQGPSQDYTAVPDPSSLSYGSPDGNYYMRDIDMRDMER